MNKQQIYKYIGTLLIGIFAGIYVITVFKPAPSMKPYERKIDSLSNIINANERKINLQDTKIATFNEALIKLDNQNVLLLSRVDKLTQNANKKIKAVDHFTNDSLFKSISSRYK